MKRSKKIIGALFVSAVVVGSSLTAFASNWHSAATADAVLKNNYSLAVAITDCSRVPCTEFIGIESTITGQGDDFSETGVGSSGVPTCQVFASTNDVRGFTSAHSTQACISIIKINLQLNCKKLLGELRPKKCYFILEMQRLYFRLITIHNICVVSFIIFL